MTRAPDDIPPRFEHKFFLTNAQRDQLRADIEPFCVLDSFAAASPTKRYDVTSLYLDTPHLGFHNQKELGSARRFKLRVRSYGDSLDSPVFLEVKAKIDDMIVKTRCTVPRTSWKERLLGVPPVRAPRPEQDFRARLERFRCEPTLLVRYEREAWKSEMDAYARLTFDENICFQKADGWNLRGDAPVFDPLDDVVAFDDNRSYVLLELKFNTEVPRWFAHVARKHNLVRMSFSKYSTGVIRAYTTDLRLDPYARIPTS